jgi:mercuric ion transport protein
MKIAGSKGKLDKIGTIGVWVAALSCPACFPALISLGSVMGLGFLSVFEGIAITYYYTKKRK